MEITIRVPGIGEWRLADVRGANYDAVTVTIGRGAGVVQTVTIPLGSEKVKVTTEMEPALQVGTEKKVPGA